MRRMLPTRALVAPLTLLARAACVPAALALPAIAQAQATENVSATGTVSGRVLNASTGQYLSKAIVRIEGTEISTLTNDFGEYTLRNVPVGERSVVVTFSGMAQRSTAVKVLADGGATADLVLGTNDELKALSNDPTTITLDTFKVEAKRFQTAQQLAINEERMSVNMKSVVSADAFGDIAQGNVGEFVKFLPGVELEYGGAYTSPADASGISIRGMGAADTLIYIDGVPVSSASPASLSNAIGLDMMSINNASRVEIIKQATPDLPANAIGGQINLVSKSAFEYAKPTYSFRTYMTVNSEYASKLFRKVSGPSNKKYMSSLPGFEFTVAYPWTKNFGFSVTGSHYEEFTAQTRFRPEWTTAAVSGVDLRPFGGTTGSTLSNANGVSSLVNPFLSRISVTDAPRWQRRDSVSIKGDWKPITGLNLSSSYQYSRYDSADAARRLQFRIQRPQSWDETKTVSYPYLTAAQSVAQGGPNAVFNPNSTLDMNIDSRDKIGYTHTAYVKADYARGPWTVNLLASVSSSKGKYIDLANGHFSTVDVSATVGKMAFEDIVAGVPQKVTVYNRDGTVFDWTDLSKWTVPTIQGRSGKSESLNDIFTYRADVRRDLDFIPWRWGKFSFKAGFYREEKLDKKWGLGTGWRQTYTGPALTTADYLDTTYLGYQPGWGLPAQQWISTYRLYDLYSANPSNFNANSESDKINNWNSTVNQNKRIKDIKTEYYAMLDGKFLSDRLAFFGGLRQSSSERNGRGPQTDNDWNFIKNPDGTLYRNATLVGGNGLVAINNASSPLFANTTVGSSLRSDLTSKGIAYPTAPILSGTYDARVLQLRPNQPISGKSKGKPSYSMGVSFDITKNLVAKLGYSRSFGRISLEDATLGLLSASGSYTLNEADDSTAIPRGTIQVANPNLKPWISDNIDAALFYYTSTGGKVGVTFYQKNISNYQESISTTNSDPVFNTVLESLGLDPAYYQDWVVTTAVNGPGTSKTIGWELEAAQDLRFVPFIGKWGERFYIFGNYSTKKRKQAPTLLTARPASDDTASGGIQFATNRFSAMLKMTWSDVKLISSTNITYNGVAYPVGTYAPAVTKFDANANYQISKRWSVFVSARDIFNTGEERIRQEINSNLYPTYAQYDDYKEFGVNVTFGVKATF